MNLKETVVVAMSGGVDSSVCAFMMAEQNYRCVGMTMRLWKGKEAEESSCSTKSCCGQDSVEDARLVCDTVGIPFYAINFKEEFWQEVVTVFAQEYFRGRTPSPCILCNEKMKFDTLYQKAVEIGAAKVCTGHYARICFNSQTQRWNLLKGIDHNKDQSYFLFSMTQDQLSKTLFPLGEYTKPEIRAIAQKEGLVTAQKPESQDICFIPDGDYAAFLSRHFPEMASNTRGLIRHVNGDVLGEHEGIHTLTVGQRRGLGVAFGKPLYVEHIDAQTLEVFVGEKEDVAKLKMLVAKLNWIARVPDVGETVSVACKVRSRSKEVPAKITRMEDGRCLVCFQEPQIALSPGQAAVFYDGDVVFGGGWIESSSC